MGCGRLAQVLPGRTEEAISFVATDFFASPDFPLPRQVYVKTIVSGGSAERDGVLPPSHPSPFDFLASAGASIATCHRNRHDRHIAAG